jgi:hypothetical protein
VTGGGSEGAMRGGGDGMLTASGGSAGRAGRSGSGAGPIWADGPDLGSSGCGRASLARSWRSSGVVLARSWRGAERQC